MKKFILTMLFATMSIPCAHSYQEELPAGVNEIILGYVINNCSYMEEAQAALEHYSISSFTISPIAGQSDAVYEINLNMNLIYGDDDYSLEETQQLVLDNSTGTFLITKAHGPCLP